MGATSFAFRPSWGAEFPVAAARLEDQGYDWELPGFLNLLAEDMDHPTALGLNLVARLGRLWGGPAPCVEDRSGSDPGVAPGGIANGSNSEAEAGSDISHEIGFAMWGVCRLENVTSQNFSGDLATQMLTHAHVCLWVKLRPQTWPTCAIYEQCWANSGNFGRVRPS